MDWLKWQINFPITDPTWIFLLVLIIMLLAPLLLSKLRIPYIIGLLLAGIIIGPYGFNVLERDSSFELFGKVGVNYIMFLAGLEMDLENFKKNRLKVAIFGVITFIIPFGLGLWSSMTLLDYGFLTALLLVSMFASHTLITYPIVSRYGLSRQRSVSITVGGTAIAVALALLTLAIVSGMCGGDVTGSFWLRMAIKVAIVLTLIITVFPPLTRWFFRHYEDNILQFIYVLVLVFAGGALLEAAGMDGILGAFLVGLVVNRLIPKVSPLMNRLEFVGNAFFIPYFLIGVGMLIDVRALLVGGQALKVALIMTVVAIFSKLLAAWVTQKTFRLSNSEGGLIFGLSNAHAAATLAAVLVASKLEISPGVPLLNDDILNGAVVMVFFTCIVASIATEHAARKLAVEHLAGKNPKEPSKEAENILIPVANPDTIEYLVNMALLMKKPKRKDGLTALSIINDANASPERLVQGKQALEKAAKIGASADVTINTGTRYDLNIASGIIHTMQETNASEVIIGLHRKMALVDSFLGSLTENLLTGTHKQVMIVKNLIPVNTLARIVVAVPPKAEFEAGFIKWVKRISRMGLQLGCRVHYFAHPDTIRHLESFIKGRYKSARAEFSELSTWDDLLVVSGHVNYEDLLVFVCARRGFISYQPSLDKLPQQIGKYFNNCSLMVIYPDQYGDPQETLSFSEPLHHQELHNYDHVIRKRILNWFKKDKTK